MRSVGGGDRKVELRRSTAALELCCVLLFLLLDVSLRSQQLSYSIKQAAGNVATAVVVMASPGIQIWLAVSNHRPGLAARRHVIVGAV